MYPAALFVSNIPITLIRVIYYFCGEEESNYLILAGGVLNILNGFFNSIIYGLTKAVKDAFKNRQIKKVSLIKSSEFEREEILGSNYKYMSIIR